MLMTAGAGRLKNVPAEVRLVWLRFFVAEFRSLCHARGPFNFKECWRLFTSVMRGFSLAMEKRP